MDILGDELRGKGWEKPEMMALLWVLIQPGSLRSRIPQRELRDWVPSPRAWKILFGCSWVLLETDP